MRVIKLGTKNQVNCKNCGSTLAYEPSDVQLSPGPRSLPGPWEVECMPEPEDHYKGSVKCPVCSTSLPVDTTREQRKAQYLSDIRSDHDL